MAALAFADVARAEPSTLDVRTWRPSTDPNASLVLEPAVTPGAGVFSAGAYATYAYRPLTLNLPSTTDSAHLVEHAVGLDAVLNLGIGKRFALGALVPVTLYQTGTSPSFAGLASVPKTALGDVGVSMKGSILRNENGGFGLAALGYVSLPTGNSDAFVREDAPTVTARALAEYTLLVAAVQATVGYKLRTKNPVVPSATGGYTFGDEIPWSVGFALRPGVFGLDPGNRQRWEVGAHGSLPVGSIGPFGLGDPGSAALSPALLAVSDRIELGHYRDAYVLLGADVGLNRAIGVPVVRAVASIGWALRSHDMDHDGIDDDLDGCPEIPEDKDGFEDSDGCPDVDNDDDGILDREDACPNVAGVESTDPKKNGCPGAPPPKPPKNTAPAAGAEGAEDRSAEPDGDRDKDGIPDETDACPEEPGVPSTDPTRHGCPHRDRDGDTYENDVDKCPDAAEVWNGVDDEDGCPDEGGKPLVTFDAKNVVHLAKPVKIVGTTDPEVDAASVSTLRAIGAALNQHPEWTLVVGARPGKGDATQAQLDALVRALSVVRVLGEFTHRDGAAETVGWDAVKKYAVPGGDVAFLLFVTQTSTSSDESTGTTNRVPPKPLQVMPAPPPKGPPPPPSLLAPKAPLTSP